MSLPPLIEAAELASLIGAPDLRLVDGSWHLDGRDPQPDFAAARIPGAVLFDLEASSAADSGLPHMLPTPSAFGDRMGELGFSESDHIVVYDTVGIRSAPRVRWMLKVMGADRVQVLNGGLPAWREAGGPLESGPASPPAPAVFPARLDHRAVVDVAGVRQALDAGEQVLDARASARFRGEAAEPRPGLRAGHMPGALNLPFPDTIGADGRLKPRDDLMAAFRAVGVDPNQPVITTCGSGVTAAILSLALETLGRSSRLYDGSWADWGSRPDLPVVTGL